MLHSLATLSHAAGLPHISVRGTVDVGFVGTLRGACCLVFQHLGLPLESTVGRPMAIRVASTLAPRKTSASLVCLGLPKRRKTARSARACEFQKRRATFAQWINECQDDSTLILCLASTSAVIRSLPNLTRVPYKSVVTSKLLGCEQLTG